MPNPSSDLDTYRLIGEFETLLERRDLAAYRVVGAVQTAMRFWECQDYETARVLLSRVRAEFEAADQRVAEFKLEHQGEINRHGNRSVA